MRIAIIVDTLGAGGAERQAVVAAAELTRRGHYVELISYGQRNDFVELVRDSGVRLVRIAERGRLRIARMRALTRHLRKGRFDVVHAFKGPAGIYGRIAAKLAGVGCIFAGYRGLEREAPVSRFLNRIVSTRTDGWFANSQAVRTRVIRDFHVRADKVYVVPNAIDPASFASQLTREEAKRSFGVSGRSGVVSMIARLSTVKNHAMLLRVAKRIVGSGEDVVFVLAGDGPLRKQLESTSKSLGIEGNVEFLGTCHAIPDLLRASDVLALTSLSEGVPNALIEAGAAGLPCVSTDNGGASDVLVEGVTGYIVGVDDDASMADRILNLLRDSGSRRQMGKAARELVSRRFSPESVGERLVSVYETRLREVARRV